MMCTLRLALLVALGIPSVAAAQASDRPPGSRAEETVRLVEPGQVAFAEQPSAEQAPAQEGADPGGTGRSPERQPWRAASAVGSPGWLRFSATHRTRYEYLWNQFRPGAPGNDMALSMRTTLAGEARFDPFVLGAEIADSRLYLADDNTPLDTGMINVFEPIRLYVGAELEDFLGQGATGRVQLGRMTMAVGSRRLVTRNGSRNTTNAYTGVDLEWTSPEGDNFRGFAVSPQVRRPSAAADLRNNAFQLDRESAAQALWGVFFASRPWIARARLEVYMIGLNERDSSAQQTRNRRLLTPGFRVHRAPAAGHIDFEVETMLQVGATRASSRPEDLEDLDQLAVFAHASVGYTFDHLMRPRVLGQYDYASGDSDPDDDTQGRFDSLYGTGSFELGPSNLWGAFGRSNLSSPGLRVEVRPLPDVDAFLAYRAIWLAEARDAWTRAGIRDDTGESGTFVAHQIEARVRWRVLPGNISLQLGLTHAQLGAFASRVVGEAVQNPTYAYGQAGFEI